MSHCKKSVSTRLTRINIWIEICTPLSSVLLFRISRTIYARTSCIETSRTHTETRAHVARARYLALSRTRKNRALRTNQPLDHSGARLRPAFVPFPFSPSNSFLPLIAGIQPGLCSQRVANRYLYVQK